MTQPSRPAFVVPRAAHLIFLAVYLIVFTVHALD